MEWKSFKLNGIADIEKCVAEFNVRELNLTPYGKYKVKIFEKSNGKFVGYTNLMLKDETGSPYSGVGYGDDVESALIDTIEYFQKALKEKEFLSEDDFICSDPYDF